MIVQIPAQPLLHCLKFIDKDKRARPDLQAVHIDNGKMVATNGHAMIIYNLPDCAGQTFTLYLPPTIIGAVAPMLKKGTPDLAYDTGTNKLTIGANCIQLDKYDWTFPNYKMMTPTSRQLIATPYISLNNKLLTLFGQDIIIHFTDPQGAVVVEPYNKGDYRWYGVIMPLRTENHTITIASPLDALHGITPVEEVEDAS